MKRKIFLVSAVLLFFFPVIFRGQTIENSYIWPTDKKVLENLHNWQGYKFGLLIHFGLYSKLGVVESWGLCPEDWVSRNGFEDYCSYAFDYRNARTQFNPVNFNPEKWAKAFKGSGAKYIIFSTKHHDGFSMFDSRYTDFKITAKDCPFSVNAKSNIAKEVFNASRNEGLITGAYFSKPDWTSPDFWWPYYPPKDRNPNYDITKHPEKWKKFVNYTHNQIREIVSEYGKLDILWLDGCWILPKSKITPHIAEYCLYPFDLDIDMKTISEFVHEKQPGMLIVDRWVEGEYENYLTPEQKTPEKALDVPWESCITMGNAWGWVPNDNYKSPKELIQLLVRIVSKGGNLLLGIGPDGTGEFEPAVYQRLEEIGKWLEKNGEAIYETVPVYPYQEGKIAYTSKGKNTIYAIYLPDKDEKLFPESLLINTNLKGHLKIILPAFGQKLTGKVMKEGLRVTFPSGFREKLAAEPAVILKITNN